MRMTLEELKQGNAWHDRWGYTWTWRTDSLTCCLHTFALSVVLFKEKSFLKVTHYYWEYYLFTRFLLWIGEKMHHHPMMAKLFDEFRPQCLTGDEHLRIEWVHKIRTSLEEWFVDSDKTPAFKHSYTFSLCIFTPSHLLKGYPVPKVHHTHYQ